MINKKNKRGDIPITFLVIGIVSICILAIVSFNLASLKVSKIDLTPIKQAKLIGEKAEFYKNLGLAESEIDSLLNIKTDSQGRYISLSSDTVSIRYNLPR